MRFTRAAAFVRRRGSLTVVRTNPYVIEFKNPPDAKYKPQKMRTAISLVKNGTNA
jgi:hypothetical protein